MTHQPQEGKYPSAELVAGWHREFYHTDCRPSYDAEAFMDFQLRKACDWRREQDALICESLESVTAMNCADAIRHGSQEHE